MHGWKRTITEISRQEMAHLGTVCNLLSAIGAVPRFARPNFPQVAHSYYPFELRLSAFSDESLYRFIRAELPKGEPPPAPPYSLLGEAHALFALSVTAPPPIPDPVEYEYVGELYGNIRQGFATIDPKILFIGPSFAQDIDQWSRGLSILRVRDRETAEKAIDFIVQEGEGAPGHRKGSHYDRFSAMRRQLADAMNQNEFFRPARPVVTNPRTRTHRDAPSGESTVITMIEAPLTKATAELFNGGYLAIIAMLQQYYSYGGETLRQRTALQQGIRECMSSVIRPLAEMLSLMPAKLDGEMTAGPPFEFYYDYELPMQAANRWTMLFEMLDSVSGSAASLAQEPFPTPFLQQRMGRIAEDVRLVRDAITATVGDEFVEN